MPRGDKSKYTDKQIRQADHIAASYEDKGLPDKEAEARAWATVNAHDGGGKLSGSGRGIHKDQPEAGKSGQAGGAESHPAAKKAATRKKNSGERALI